MSQKNQQFKQATRPVRPEAEEKTPTRVGVKVWVTQSEKDALDALRKHDGRSESNYIRHHIIRPFLKDGVAHRDESASVAVAPLVAYTGIAGH